MKARPESKLVTEDPDNTASKSEKLNQAGNKKTEKQPDSKLVTEDPDSSADDSEEQRRPSGKKAEAIAGGSPSAGAVKDDTKHRDDSKTGSENLKKEAVNKSEQQNFTQKKGYNEIPSNVPVKSVREKA